MLPQIMPFSWVSVFVFLFFYIFFLVVYLSFFKMFKTGLIKNFSLISFSFMEVFW